MLMLTGRKLFESQDDLELTSKILNDEPPRAADLIEAFDALATEHRWTQREAEQWWATKAAGSAPARMTKT